MALASFATKVFHFEIDSIPLSACMYDYAIKIKTSTVEWTCFLLSVGVYASILLASPAFFAAVEPVRETDTARHEE